MTVPELDTDTFRAELDAAEQFCVAAAEQAAGQYATLHEALSGEDTDAAEVLAAARTSARTLARCCRILARYTPLMGAAGRAARRPAWQSLRAASRELACADIAVVELLAGDELSAAAAVDLVAPPGYHARRVADALARLDDVAVPSAQADGNGDSPARLRADLLVGHAAAAELIGVLLREYALVRYAVDRAADGVSMAVAVVAEGVCQRVFALAASDVTVTRLDPLAPALGLGRMPAEVRELLAGLTETYILLDGVATAAASEHADQQIAEIAELSVTHARIDALMNRCGPWLDANTPPADGRRQWLLARLGEDHQPVAGGALASPHG